MAKVVILGAGIAGHTAALIAKRKLGSKHEVVVVSPNTKYQWIPSNIWVGIGQMTARQVTFELAPVYKKLGINYEQAKAVAILPEGDAELPGPFVMVESTRQDQAGELKKIEYDYLINATGPR